MITHNANFEPVRRLIQCQRLLRLAQNPTNVAYVKSASAQIGLTDGARVIDVGCGPAGALIPLAEIVGPRGLVVGLDRNHDVVEIARRVVSKGGLDQVKIVHADLDTFGEDHGYPLETFDAAYCRLVLFNQQDPATTLRRVAALVRPGGHVIVHEVLDDPSYPCFDPPIQSFGKLRRWFNDCLSRQGRSPDVARRLNVMAREAGLGQVTARGLVDANVDNAVDFIQEQGLNLLLVFRHALMLYGIATRAELDELAVELRQATSVQYRFFLSWIMVEMIARKPD